MLLFNSSQFNVDLIQFDSVDVAKCDSAALQYGWLMLTISLSLSLSLSKYICTYYILFFKHSSSVLFVAVNKKEQWHLPKKKRFVSFDMKKSTQIKLLLQNTQTYYIFMAPWSRMH